MEHQAEIGAVVLRVVGVQEGSFRRLRARLGNSLLWQVDAPPRSARNRPAR